MARTLDERITSARSTDRITIKDLKALIAEVHEEEIRQRAVHDSADAESVDLALSEADRDEAARLACRATRLAKAYADAAVELETKLKAKIENEKRQAAEAERQAALAERDEIAERFKVIVPQAISAMTELYEQVETNAARMKKAGLREPTAEAVARGIKGHFIGYSPVAWYTEMKIPAFDGKGRAWPIERHVDHYALSAKRMAEQKRAIKKQNAEREAEFGRYRIEPFDGDFVSFRARASSDPGFFVEQDRLLGRQGFLGMLRHTEAERLRGLGVKVERIDQPAAEAAE